MSRVTITEPIYFRFRELGNEILLTNDFGSYLFLSKEEFEQIRSGRNRVSEETYRKLEDQMFILSKKTLVQAAEKYRKRSTYMQFGPNLHILVTTLRCTTTCTYCHSSIQPESAEGFDMSLDTAKRAIDVAFQSSSPGITFEFQGGEPTLNWPVITFTLEYAREKNKKHQKKLDFSVVTNFSNMTDEMLDVLIAPDVHICTSLDGTAIVHDKNRKLPGKSAYQLTVENVERVNKLYIERGYDPLIHNVQGIFTLTRQALPFYKEIVDEYVRLNMKVIHFRLLDHYGFAAKTLHKISFSVEEYLEFYQQALDYIVELNKQGTEIMERLASFTMQKIFNSVDPNYLDLRNPCGAGIGQVAYNYDGKVFTCDEGRMIFEMGEDLFQIGDLKSDSLDKMMKSDAVHSCAVASCQESQHDCMVCAYKPYCGICPVYNFMHQGDIFGNMRTNGHCMAHKSVFDYLFGKLQEADGETFKVLRRWAINKHLPETVVEI